MNSFRFRRTRSLAEAAAAVALVAATLAPSASFAQSPAMPSLPGDGAPAMQGFGQPAAAPKINLPKDASIGDAQERVKTLATEASRDLDGLVGGAVPPGEQADLKSAAERKRNLLFLKDKLEEAKVAKELWKELNGDQQAADDRVKVLEDEKAKLEGELKRMASTPGGVANGPEPLPVVASITGGSGASASADVLVPYQGQFKASVGTVLPGGHRVVEIGRGGVVVVKDGARSTLSFGTSVPSTRPAPATGAGSVQAFAVQN